MPWQALSDGVTRAAEQLESERVDGGSTAGAVPVESEATAALREALGHLEQGRQALTRQQAAVDGIAAALQQGKSLEARLSSALNETVEGQCDALASSLASLRDSLTAALQTFAPESGADMAQLLSRAQLAAQEGAEAALVLLETQGASAQSAVEAHQAVLAREEGQQRIAAEGHGLLIAGARQVSAALRAQGELLLAAREMRQAGPMLAEGNAACVVDTLKASLPLLGTGNHPPWHFFCACRFFPPSYAQWPCGFQLQRRQVVTINFVSSSLIQ